MSIIVGRKIGMTQVFSDSGELVAVTAVEVEPNLVFEVKTKEKHGYSAVVVAYGSTKKKSLNKPELGQFEKRNLEIRRKIIELRNLNSDFSTGDFLKIEDSFKAGDLVDVQGITRGHGLTGAIKLWNFSCGPRTHGAGYPHRYQGSLETGRGGMSPQKVWKGKKMSGRYGNEKVSMVNLEILYIDAEKNLVLLKGAIPGRSSSLVKMKTTTRKRKQKETAFKLLKHERN